ncbi:MAG TPA: tRNA dihydrouridine synthase DusB [Clostridia bacterium]|nr:tRNA dihydrouridine synthase DusB [Clostridia bacterium]
MIKKDLVIGSLQLPNNILLAPMAGITDLPFRLICKGYGCGMVFTEMVSAKGLYYGSERTEDLLLIHPAEKPIGVQIFGSEPRIMGEMADRISDLDIGLIDINMGCPAPKIIKGGQGSALMRDPERVRKIVKAVVKSSSKPVTIKIRKGWDDAEVNAVEIAKIACDEGASAITVHGRTREQFYSGKADWEVIKRVREAVHIPVIGNGDVFTPEDAFKMFDYTGCHGIMVARGAQGRPWIFRDIIHYLKTGSRLLEPPATERISIAVRHLKLAVELKGERLGVIEMRKHLAWYLKGMKNVNTIKNTINSLENSEQIQNTLFEYLEKEYN